MNEGELIEMAEAKKIQVSKVTDSGGRVFYTRELDRSVLLALPNASRVEDAWMSEEEFDAIPATDEARAFFAGGENVRGRS